MSAQFMVTGGAAFPVPATALDTGATWLDVCAWHAMQALVTANGGIGVAHMAQLTTEQHQAMKEIGIAAYNIAQAMLAEKLKREAQ